MERGGDTAGWRLRATAAQRDRRQQPPRDEGGRGAAGKKRGGRRPLLPLPEARGAPLVLLYLLGLRALAQVSHRQLLSRPPAAGPRDFSAARARYRGTPGGGRPSLLRGRVVLCPGQSSELGKRRAPRSLVLVVSCRAQCLGKLLCQFLVDVSPKRRED